MRSHPQMDKIKLVPLWQALLNVFKVNTRATTTHSEFFDLDRFGTCIKSFIVEDLFDLR